MKSESSLIGKENLSSLLEDETRLEIMSDDFRKKHVELEQERFQIDDFTDVWSADTIKQAQQAVRNFKNSLEFNRANDEIGQVGEDVVYLGCLLEEWVPGIDQVFTTSRFDDYLRGVDIVLKFVPDAFQDRNKKAIYLGLDVKTTLDNGGVADKIKKIEERLSHPEEATIEFFMDKAETVDAKTRAKYANVLPPRKIKANEYFNPATAVAAYAETQENSLAGRLSLPRVALHLDPKLCVAMEKILVKDVAQRTPQEKERANFTKFMLNVNLINQLFALDLYFDLKKMSSAEHKLLQKQYQEAIEAVLESLNLRDLLAELDKIIEMMLAMKYQPKNVLRDLQTKKSDMLEYIEIRNLKI